MTDGFFRRWGKGMRELSVTQQLSVKRISIIGQLVGMCLVIGVMVYTKNYFWLVLLGFTSLLLVSEWLGVNRELRIAKEVEKVMRNV
jgi:hypothetical protein